MSTSKVVLDNQVEVVSRAGALARELTRKRLIISTA